MSAVYLIGGALGAAVVYLFSRASSQNKVVRQSKVERPQSCEPSLQLDTSVRILELRDIFQALSDEKLSIKCKWLESQVPISVQGEFHCYTGRFLHYRTTENFICTPSRLKDMVESFS